MPQPKNGLINLINNQGNRSDNDAPQDQCCFVVFMSFGGLDSKCGLVSRLVVSRLVQTSSDTNYYVSEEPRQN